MNRRRLLVGLSLMLVCLSGPLAAEVKHRCIKCHSKRPGARAMHEALKGQDCFDCHVRGEKLRQKGGIPKEKHEAFLKQRLADPRCIRCHGKKKSEAFDEGQAKHAVPLSGRTFCPKCQIIGDKDWTMCPKCGGPLIELDRIMRLSAIHPDQTLCRKCHFMEGVLQNAHIESVDQEFRPEQDCLECHEGHSECAGCH